MQKILGLDLGAANVKAVAIEASFRHQVVRAFRMEPVPPSPAGEEKPYAERLRSVLEMLAADDWLSADVIAVAMPGVQVASHIVTIPFGDPKRVELTLPGEVEEVIPFKIEDVVWDSQLVSRTPSKSELLVTVARKADVRAVLDQLKLVGVDPAIVTFAPLALQNLFAEGFLGTPTPDATEPGTIEAIIDIGASRTNVLLVEGGQVRFARTLATGGDDVSRALMRAMNIDAATAESMKAGISLDSSDPTLATVVERACAPLVRDLRATFAAHASRTRRRIESIRVCGGGARLAGLPALLASSLGVALTVLEMPTEQAFPDAALLPEGSLALSLALGAAGGKTASKLNFRKGEFVYAKAVDESRGYVGALVAMAAVLVVLIGVSTWAHLRTLRQREAQVDDVICETTRRILGTCETDTRIALGKLKGKGSPAASIPESSALELLVNVTQSFPPGPDAVLSDLDIVDKSVRMRGDARSYDVVDNLVAELQKNKCFGDVKKGKLAKGKDDRIGFDLDATWTCGAAKAG